MNDDGGNIDNITFNIHRPSYYWLNKEEHGGFTQWL